MQPKAVRFWGYIDLPLMHGAIKMYVRSGRGGCPRKCMKAKGVCSKNVRAIK